MRILCWQLEIKPCEEAYLFFKTLSTEDLEVLLATVDWQTAIESCGVYHAIIRGDDAFMVADRPVATLLKHIVRGAGFIIKMKVGHCVSKVRFCSNMMWPVDHPETDYLPGPTFKCLAKYGTFQTPTVLSERKLTEELRGKALGLLPMCSHIPCLHEANVHVIQATKNVRGSRVALARKRIETHYHVGASVSLAPRAIEFAAEAYGVTAAVIQAVMHDIDRAPWNTLIATPAMRQLMMAVVAVEG